MSGPFFVLSIQGPGTDDDVVELIDHKWAANWHTLGVGRSFETQVHLLGGVVEHRGVYPPWLQPEQSWNCILPSRKFEVTHIRKALIIFQPHFVS